MIGALTRLGGARRLAVAAILGATATAAMPPFHVVPLLWVAFPLLLGLLEGCARPRDNFLVGWGFGFGHFGTGFFWIANAFYVDADQFGAFAIPAVAALCAGFAVYSGIVALAVRLVPPAAERLMPDERTWVMLRRGALLALAWTTMEWFRGWFLSGFPWNPVALVWAAWPAMLQSVSIVGALGLGLVTMLAVVAASPLLAPPRFPLAWMAAAMPLAGLGMVAAAGAVRLSLAPVEHVPGVTLRLVQPNIAQADKWRPALRDQHLMDHIRLSIPDGTTPVTHVVWGEAAVAFALDQDEARRRLVAEAVPTGGVLIAGVTRADRSTRGVEAIYNSMLAIDDQARVLAVYDKTHLVPFGEYLPLRPLIPFPKLTDGTMDFSPGRERRTLNLPGLPPVGPLICYEAIFSGAVVGSGPPPAWMLNITNDSWFGDSTGPRQHLAQARMRAVEQGLPMVRVANTGVSAVFDAYGRLEASLDLGARGVLDVALPRAVAGGTVFAAAGNGLPLGLVLVSTLGLLWQTRRATDRRP